MSKTESPDAIVVGAGLSGDRTGEARGRKG